ncbi:MAG: 3-dehydroquinate synthase [Clostridia bacterium]
MYMYQVSLDERSYPIYISTDGFNPLGSVLKASKQDYTHILIVSDENVASLYLQAVASSLSSAGFSIDTFIIPPGEQSKSLEMADKIYEKALEIPLDRKSAVLALGGGVVGDLAGFIAATYMRGISFLQAPASLLAQVDSSVGGKVAVNHPLGKNTIGAFHQPNMVYIAADCLLSLPHREFISGIAEVVKYGIILDRTFFEWLEEYIDSGHHLHLDSLVHIIKTSCQIKAQIISQDEKEENLRAILNYGHTVGHAIETVTDFSRYTHGEGIAIGMVYEAKISSALGLMPSSSVSRIARLLQKIGLPIKIEGLDPELLLQYMMRDKKNIGGKLVFVLPDRIGHVRIFKDVDINLVREVLNE